MLENMDAFFDRRLDIYDEHQLSCIDSARVFYPYTAELLPRAPKSRVLDLGCGTGLELEYYFKLNPTACVTGIDLAPGMLEALARKFPAQNLELVCGSYFDVPLGENRYDVAVSVESLHHFTQAEKIPLYSRVRRALRSEGYFILTDYFAGTPEEERQRRSELIRLKREQGLPDGTFYHYDTPLTVAHEAAALRAAGFTQVETLDTWGATATLRAQA